MTPRNKAISAPTCITSYGGFGAKCPKNGASEGHDVSRNPSPWKSRLVDESAFIGTSKRLLFGNTLNLQVGWSWVRRLLQNLLPSPPHIAMSLQWISSYWARVTSLGWSNKTRKGPDRSGIIGILRDPTVGNALAPHTPSPRRARKTSVAWNTLTLEGTTCSAKSGSGELLPICQHIAPESYPPLAAVLRSGDDPSSVSTGANTVICTSARDECDEPS